MAKGNGSVKATGRGVWRIRVSTGKRRPSGSYIYREETFHGTERQAEKRRDELAAEVGGDSDDGDDEAVDPADPDRTLADALDDHMTALTVEGRSPATLRGYRWRVDEIKALPIGATKLGALRSRDLSKLYERLLDGRKPKTIYQHHALISGALRRAGVPPQIAGRSAYPHPAAAEIVVPDEDALADVFALAWEHDPARAMFLQLTAATGLRRGEVCGFRWSDVGADSVLLARQVCDARESDVGASRTSGGVRGKWSRAGGRFVVVKQMKTGRRRRIKVDDSTLLALTLHRARAERLAEQQCMPLRPDAFVFSDDPDGLRPWHPDVVTTFVTKVRAEVGPHAESVTLHRLRHYVATTLLAKGVNPVLVSERLGHHSTRMTLDVYGHARPAEDDGAAEILGAALGEIMAPKEAEEV
jgi:integrase